MGECIVTIKWRLAWRERCLQLKRGVVRRTEVFRWRLFLRTQGLVQNFQSLGPVLRMTISGLFIAEA